MTNPLLGLGGNPELDTAISELNRLAIQVNNLAAGRDVGNVLGGMIRTEIAPGLLPIGPYRQDVDGTFSLEFTLWISEEILRIRKLTLHLTPKPSRMATGVSASSGTLTSNASGAVVNVESAGHVHIWLSKTGAVTLAGTSVAAGNTNGPNSVINATFSPHAHVETGGTTNNDAAPTSVATSTHVHSPGTTQLVAVVANYSAYGSYDSSGTADANRNFDMLPKSGTPTDYYTAISSQTPTSVSLPSHTHDTPGHTHPITLSISESGMADNLHLYVDGVDRSVALGGPWTAASTIVLDPNDILAIGLVDARLDPVTGPHVIKVTSTAAGAVEVVGDYSVIIKGVQ